MRGIGQGRLFAGVALGVLGFASAASAQQASGAAAASTVSEIIVTAQKRSERLQDVPLSVSAVTEQSMKAQGISSFSDVVSREPGLHLSADSTQSSFTVRGIAATTSGDTTSATAGVYLDDYPLYDTWYRFTSPDLRVYDTSRIEVLRGPQGTLYGATSLSGSVRIITNKPNLGNYQAQLEATGSATAGGDGSYALSGLVNVPLIEDKLGLRLVGYTRKDGGWVDNPVRGASNVNGKSDYGGRFYLTAEPTPDWNITLSLMYQHDVHDDQDATYYSPPAGRRDTDFNAVLPTKTRSDLGVASLSIDRKIGAGDLNLSATLGYDRSHNVTNATPISTLFGAPLATPWIQPGHSRTQIAEARYSSDPSQPFRYTVGLYFNRRYRALEQVIDQPALAPVFGTPVIYDVFADQTAIETAAYGEATWAFAPKWQATLGLRVFNMRYHFNGNVFGILNNPRSPLAVNLTDVSNSNTSATPRFSLSYKPRRAWNLYATISEGYRFGLTNYNSGSNAGTPLTYKPDTLWNYEVGSKATFWDGRGSLNTSVYYEDWRDMQVSFRNPQGQIYVTNAGNARSYGVENELMLRPDPAWEINAALTLGQAELTTSSPGIVGRSASVNYPAILGVTAGDPLPGSQKVSGSFGVQYNVQGIGPGSGYIRIDDIYVGKSYTDFITDRSLRIGDYNLVNLRAAYNFGNFEVVLFSDNVFNSHGVVNAVPNGDLIRLTDWAYRVHPRTIGVTFRAQY